MECFEGLEGCLKSNLHLIAEMSETEEATELCRQLMHKITNALNREYFLNATTVVKFPGYEFLVRGAAIHIAASSGNTKVARLLCEEYGVDVNCNTSETLGEEPRKGVTPLMWAVWTGDVAVVKALLDNHTNTNMNARRTNDGITALHVAAGEGLTEIVKLLLDHHADVNVISTGIITGITALYNAARQGHIEIVKLLLDHHADVNIRSTGSKSGYTALHAAAMEGHTEIVRLLLDHHADMNIRSTGSNAGYTALHYAAWQGHTEIVKLLLVNKADMNACTADGSKPIDLAQENHHEDIVKLLEHVQYVQYESIVTACS